MNKQDRVFTRTPSDLERKYNLGQYLGDNGSLIKLPKQMRQLSQELSRFMTEISVKVSKLQNKIDDIYAVGSIFVSVYEDNPSYLFGGEWELCSEGYLVMGLDETIESVHSLTQSQDKCYVWKRIE